MDKKYTAATMKLFQHKRFFYHAARRYNNNPIRILDLWLWGDNFYAILDDYGITRIKTL